MPPEHDRYDIKFLSSSRITCLCRCPVILYCFLCALHFVEMPSSRPTHFVEKNSVPLQFGGARPHQGNFKGDHLLLICLFCFFVCHIVTRGQVFSAFVYSRKRRNRCIPAVICDHVRAYCCHALCFQILNHFGSSPCQR